MTTRAYPPDSASNRSGGDAPRPKLCQAHGRASASGRRHLRAVPPVPRAASRPPRSGWCRGRRDARGRVRRCSTMLEDGATHLGVATDHVIESFRNDLWDDLQDGGGDRPAPQGAVPAARGRARRARRDGVADGGVSKPTTRSRARPHVAAADDRVEQVDHLHARQGSRSVRRRQGRAARPPARHPARRRRRTREVRRRRPQSIPDWLALVGDTADGFPGLPGFGAKTAAAVLARYGHLEAIPDDPRPSGTSPACAAPTGSRRRSRPDATSPTRFKVLATLRIDADGRHRRRLGVDAGPRPSSTIGASGSGRRDSPSRADEARAEEECVGDDG